MHWIVVVGASAGGIQPLEEIVRQLPADFPAPIFVVVHLPENYESALPQMLTRAGSLQAIHPYNGQQMQPGTIYVAPTNHHMVVIDHHIQLTNTPKENRHRPAIDPLFRSVAKLYGPRAIGIILSGVLDDGTGGLQAIKQQGGTAIVQDPEDAMFAGMPTSACHHVAVDHVISANKIPPLLEAIVATEAKPATLPIGTPQNQIDITEFEDVTLHNLHDQPGEITPYACPDCNGNLWIAEQDGFVQYWCHIGHRYTQQTLLAAKTDKIEGALFEALRNLKEGTMLGQEAIQAIAQIDDAQVLEKVRQDVHLWQKQLELIQNLIEREIDV